jgi:hypothetical protein
MATVTLWPWTESPHESALIARFIDNEPSGDEFHTSNLV